MLYVLHLPESSRPGRETSVSSWGVALAVAHRVLEPYWRGRMTVPDAVELLLVEDNEEDLTLALRALRKANLANKIHIVRDGAEALDFIFCEGVYAARRIEEVLSRYPARPEAAKGRRHRDPQTSQG